MSIVRVEAVSKSFRQAETVVPVLNDLHLDVEKGETMAIIGQSGSGKSTLLSLLAGLDRPDTGRVSILDQDLGSMTQSQLTEFRGRSIGIVFQQFHLMRSLSALDNVLLPLDIAGKRNAEKEAMDALELVGLGHRAHHLPQQLSGGELQRVAIARAFVVRPSILLADEPSGNLDFATGTKVMNLLFEAVRERSMTMILVTHDSQLADRCQKKQTLHQGTFQGRS